jgi:hypothetical protein
MRNALAAGIFAALTPVVAVGQTYAKFPADQDVQNTVARGVQVEGCACGMGPAATNPQLRNMLVSPTSGKPILGQAFQIRYDASAICRGQSVRDTNGVAGAGMGPLGTANWQTGAIQDLPDAYGIISYAFPSAGHFDVTIHIKLQCYDSGAKCQEAGHYSTCEVSATVPVDVSPK